LGIFDESDVEGIPIIRIVFALVANTPSVTILPPRDQTLSSKAYDIWCSGISSTCLAPVRLEDESTWKYLVETCQWKDIYKVADKIAKELRMTMNPGVGQELAFWKAWTTLES